MPDEVIPTATPTAEVAPAAAVLPAAESVVAAPAAEAPPVAAEPAKTEAKPVEAAKTDAPLLTPEVKTEVKPDTKAEPGKTEEKPVETPKAEDAPLPTYEKFTFPEGVTFDEARMTDFNKKLGEFEKTSKATHEEVQKFGQALLNEHIAEIKTAIERHDALHVENWNKKKIEWANSFKADPELGGKRYETTLAESREFIKTHGGSQKQQDAFYAALKETGMDYHPEMVRFIHNLKNSNTFRTPASLPAMKPAVQTSKINKRYGGE